MLEDFSLGILATFKIRINKFFEVDFVIKIIAISERRFDGLTFIFKLSRRIKWHAYSICVKVSARVKKGEFSKFLISRCSDKAFQELSFKKNSTKNILSVQSYWTLKFTAR